MPAAALWLVKVPALLEALKQDPEPYWSVAQFASMLSVSPRRVQQILQPLGGRRLGAAYLISRIEAIRFFEDLTTGEASHFASQKQRRIEQLRRMPRLLIQAPAEVENTRFHDLPDGVQLSPGRIVVEGFQTSEEALQILLALAKAVSNNLEEFAQQVDVLQAPKATEQERVLREFGVVE